ncbi:MAG: translation initiation factor IF-2 [Treponema sp.]|jgi:translation initiation factor IF-2|nr:translation initiation factor IF-2 [Treponema sp.]
MTADTENSQKPKAELIKRSRDIAGSRNDAEVESGNKPVETERKKVVRIKKKPAAATGSERITPKVKVVARGGQGQTGLSNTINTENSAASVAQPTGGQSTAVTQADSDTTALAQQAVATQATAGQPQAEAAVAAQPAVTTQPPAAAQPAATADNQTQADADKPVTATQQTVTTQPAADTQQADKRPVADRRTSHDEKNKNTDGSSGNAAVSHVSVYKETARPAVQAGRVGGKFIGPKPQRGGSNGTGDNNQNWSGNRSDGVKNDARKPATYVGRGNGRRGGNQGGGQPYGQRPGGDNSSRQGGGHPGAQANGRNAGQGGGYTAGGGYNGGGGNGGGGNNGGRFSNNGARGAYGGQNAQNNQSRPSGYGANNFGSGYAPRTGGQGRPAPVTPIENKGPVKRTFKAKKPEYQRRDKEIEMEEKLHQIKKRSVQAANPVPKSIDIMEVVSVSELARKMNLKASDLIAKLMSMGQMVTINQQIDSETATILASEFGADVNIVSLYDETLIETMADDIGSMMPRPPVVTVMGHVDHGKTKLLDAIRSADVVSGEFGGITQHIGAYMVETSKGSITFLDTPGHEAFTRMRSRGAQVTDIVVLVVAADDGVMPQTIEAINHAKEADVPIIVAINKIDKPDANPDRVRSQLSELGLQPEEWGGQTMFVELSALKKEGLDTLIETILLQAEILDLRVNYNRSAEGKILESRIDHGRGIVATILVEKGVLEIGDSFVAGIWPGKVRAIFNDKGIRVDRASPSMPVEVLGFEGIPNAGDPLQVVEDEKIARSFSAKRQELKRFEDAKNIRKITLDNLYDTISDGEIQELKVIIKGDVQGSVEALRASLEKLSTKEVRLAVIQALPGAINEGDVDLASASNAVLIGFNVRPTPKAKALADQEKVDIRRYNIIYRVVEDMQKAMEGLLKPDTKEEIIADVEVREVFKISKTGVIAGCYVRSGTVKRGASVNVIRSDTVIYTGKIASLRRFKDDVKEVATGFECGMGIEGFDDIKSGDEFEVFEIVEVARKL